MGKSSNLTNIFQLSWNHQLVSLIYFHITMPTVYFWAAGNEWPQDEHNKVWKACHIRKVVFLLIPTLKLNGSHEDDPFLGGMAYLYLFISIYIYLYLFRGHVSFRKSNDLCVSFRHGLVCSCCPWLFTWAMKKNMGWFGYIGDEILPNYVKIKIPHSKDPYSPTRIQWKVMSGFFSWLTSFEWISIISIRTADEFDLSKTEVATGQAGRNCVRYFFSGKNYKMGP